MCPTGTTAGPRVEKLEEKVQVVSVVSCYLWNFIGLPRLEGEKRGPASLEDLIFSDFQRKKDKKEVWIREE